MKVNILSIIIKQISSTTVKETTKKYQNRAMTYEKNSNNRVAIPIKKRYPDVRISLFIIQKVSVPTYGHRD